jgi:hypothetical protein
MIKKDNTGIKYDQHKPRFDLLPYDALNEIAKVFSYGAIKYEPRNWEKGMSWSRVFASMQRHLSAWFHGNNIDSDSNMSHLSHAACCALYLLAFECRREGIDDRPKLSNDSLQSMEDYSKIKEYFDRVKNQSSEDVQTLESNPKIEYGIKPQYA